MTIYNAVGSNKRRTWLIMALFIIFFVTVGYVLSRALGYGMSFAGVMLVISGVISFASYYYSDKLILVTSGAKPADPKAYAQLHHVLEELAIGDGLPKPRLYIVNEPAPNAFATGRDPKHSAVAVTTGLLEKLKRGELEGVLAHELSHVKNFDTRLMGIVAILVGSLAILSDVFMRSLWWGGLRDDEDRQGNQLFAIFAIILAVVTPIAATLIQLAISRRREFLADADGALLTRYPDGLADALEKIAADRNILRHASNATAHLYIENPFKADTGRKLSNGIANLFSTHPPIEERIKILRAM